MKLNEIHLIDKEIHQREIDRSNTEKELELFRKIDDQTFCRPLHLEQETLDEETGALQVKKITISQDYSIEQSTIENWTKLLNQLRDLLQTITDK